MVRLHVRGARPGRPHRGRAGCRTSAVTLVSWISQTFLQLVLLSVIIVGQNVLADAADKRSEATYKGADAVLHESVKIQEHLLAQDQVLSELVDRTNGATSPKAP